MTDLIFAARMLRKNLGFTFVAVITLALGVGANTTIFSVVKAVLINQLPYRDPDRLVVVASGTRGERNTTVDFTTTYDWRARSRSFESLSLFRIAGGAIFERGQAELLQGMRVSSDYFDALGVTMQLGRNFLAEEDRPDRRYEIVLTYGLWQRRFGGDPKILGRVLTLTESNFTVVGVLPASFQQPLLIDNLRPEIYMPLGYALGGPSSCRGCQHLQLIGRLKPGVTVAQSSADLNSIMRDLIREYPKEYARGQEVRVDPLRDRIVGNVSTALWVLLGAVGFVLLIACANVANLLLSRATGRTKEIALRAALGAGRRRIIRQLLTESLLLALMGGVAGVLLATWATSALASLGPKEIPRVHEIKIDALVMLFALAATVLTGGLFGLAPALRASRADLNDALKDLGKSTDTRSRHGLRNLLVTAELALAFVLVVGAGLLAKSFLHLMNVDPGYDPHNVLTMKTYVYGKKYQNADVELAYYRAAFDRLRAAPGVESIGMVSTLPLASFDRRALHIQDRPLPSDADAPSPDAYSVSPDYFRVMRIPLKQGRFFTEQDRQGAPLVAIVSESCARKVFPNESAIGKHIQLGGRHDDKPWMTIVGIVGDVRQYGLDTASNMGAYIAQAQDVSFTYTLVVRTTGDPKLLEHAAQDAFTAADKTLPVYDATPMETYLRVTLAERTFTLLLLALFGAMALLLAAVGIYGVISYAVTLRTREVGIRVALGAERRDVVNMVLRQSLALIGTGLGAGFLASLVLTRLLSSLLYEVRPADLSTALAVAALLAATALAASYIPARRATRVDPMVALRYE